MSIKDRLIELFEDNTYKPLKFNELANLLGIESGELAFFADILDELESEGRVVKTKKGKYAPPHMVNMIIGTLRVNEKGFGFVVSERDRSKEVFIPAEFMNGAMNQDRVVVRIIKSSKQDKKPEGEIIRILSRTNTKLVGRFEKSKYYGFVIPDDRRITTDIYVPKSEFNGAVTGSKVVVEITRWPTKRRNPEGKIVEILGMVGQPGIDIMSIAKSYGLEEKFPDDVINQVKTIPMTIPENELSKRRDLRKLRIVTIDDEDAKDLDDAISIEKLPNGNYLLGVHIADVSYYVTEGSPLDREALRRGTSVYLIDKVIPMLPKELSNGICSLNAGEDRLAFSVMMEIDGTGRVIRYDIFKSVIKVSERMSYKNVTKILIDEDKELIERYKDYVEDFKIMLELCNILRKKREDRGSIDFDFPEVKIILDQFGKPIQIKKYESTVSNRIIEEFMIVCNETIAERMFWTNVPFIYRIHEDPDPEKIKGFNDFLNSLGYSIKGVNKLHPKAFQDVINKIKGKKEEKIVSTLMLRSLQHARYSDKNEGHFGLASKYYCHFTSPIRRYPDLFIHRVISEVLENDFTIDEKRHTKLAKLAREAAKVSSETEKTAEEVERAVEELKKVEFMEDKVGEVFEGIISSVTSFGFFVELENLIEGLVHIEDLKSDNYYFDEKRYCLIGKRTKRVFRIGDEVTVRLIKADVEARRLDFMLEEDVKEVMRRGKVKRKQY